MAKAPFFVYKRTDKKGKVYFSVRYQDSDGTPIRTITLKEAKNKTQAVRIAEQKLKDGIISNKANPDSLEYFYSFWQRGSSYVKGRELRGVKISDKYLHECKRLIEKKAAPYLKGKKILDLTPNILEKMILDLSKKGESARQINYTLQAIKVPYAHFTRMNHLVNPLLSVQKIREEKKERGILSQEEIKNLINMEDDNPRVKAAILLGALCGLRLGEIRGLQWEDINEEEGTISIRHNLVDKKEGIKRPKWGSDRTVPAPQPVLDALKLCSETAPQNVGDFAIWNQRSKKDPVPSASLRNGFKKALNDTGIGYEEQQDRNIVFHGLRHTFVSLSRSSGLPDYIVQRLAGHKSMEMTNDYTHTEGILDFKKAKEAMEKAVS